MALKLLKFDTVVVTCTVMSCGKDVMMFRLNWRISSSSSSSVPKRWSPHMHTWTIRILRLPRPAGPAGCSWFAAGRAGLAARSALHLYSADCGFGGFGSMGLQTRCSAGSQHPRGARQVQFGWPPSVKTGHCYRQNHHMVQRSPQGPVHLGPAWVQRSLLVWLYCPDCVMTKSVTNQIYRKQFSEGLLSPSFSLFMIKPHKESKVTIQW